MGWLGDAWDTVKDTASDVWSGAKDTFSSQDVSGPTPGAWGAEGTAAAAANQQQQQQGSTALLRGQTLGQNAQDRGQNLGQSAQVRGQQLGQQASDFGTANANASLNTAHDAQSRTGPATNWNPTQQTQGGTQQTLNALNNFAANSANSPSAAQAVANQTQSQGVGQALALARSGRGMGGNAAATGQAQGTIAQTNANAASQGSQIAANEDAAAKQRQLAALNSSLGGGLGLGQQQSANAQFDTNTALNTRGQNDAFANANNQNALAWNGQGQQGQLGFESLGQQGQLGFNSLGQQGQLGFEQQGNAGDLAHQTLGQNALNSQANYELTQNQLAQQAKTANQTADTQRDSANLGFVSSIAGAAAMASDERVKKDIKSLRQKDSALSNALGTLGNAPGFSYKYKDPNQPGAAHGTQVSSMAQDLEAGPLGKRVVFDSPNGKMVNYTEIMKMTPGAITELNHKVAALEKALGGKRVA